MIEYLTMYGRLYGSADPGALATAGLRRFGIEDLARRMGTELSSGQRTLVGIVKATMHAPSLLILDEPTASLDPEVALRVRAGLLDLCRAKTTALLVTSHNMAEVEQLAERMIFILGGRLVADGSPAAITAQLGHASLEEVYLQLSGSAPEPEAARSGA